MLLLAVSFFAIAYTDWSTPTQLTAAVAILVLALWFIVSWHRNTDQKLQNLESLLLSLKEEDYSAQLQEAADNEPLNRTVKAANSLSTVLRKERTGAVEYSNLLQKVIEQINAGVLAFDQDGAISLISDRCCDTLQLTREELLSKSANELGLEALLNIETMDVWSPEGDHKKIYQVRRSSFRERGKVRTLVTLTDVSQPLRKQELLAWQKIIKVLRHEMSNSLAPIQSYVQTLQANLKNLSLSEADSRLFNDGFEVIGKRSQALSRLTSSYRSLTDLPSPSRAVVNVPLLLNEMAALFTNRAINIQVTDPIKWSLDKDQIQQVLVNLMKNADEAMASQQDPILIECDLIGPDDSSTTSLRIALKDNGPGISSTENLFVPFYTTKSDGEGIGLALSRLILERHGGTLQLENRSRGGTIATLTIPPA